MMEIRRMRLDDLFPADYNPRKALKKGDVEYENLRQSIETFGLVEPLIWNTATGRLVGGHQRLTVLRDLGMAEVDVSVVDLDEDHEKALNIALNKIGGAWDDEALAALLRELEASDMSYLTGFAEVDIEALIGGEQSKDTWEESAEDLPELSCIGDIWLLGQHRLMCGDSTNAAHVDQLMDGNSARLVITDPPYNVAYESKVQDTSSHSGRATSRIENDNMDSASFRLFLRAVYQQLYRLMAPGAAIYVFHGDSEGVSFRSEFTDAGFKLSGCLIWAKNTIVLGRSDYQWRHEPILYGWRQDGAHKWYGGRKKSTVIQPAGGISIDRSEDGDVITFTDGMRSISILAKDYQVLDDGASAMSSIIYHEKPGRNDLHPTMKPVDLISKLMRNSSKRGDLVADLFGGSGSTLIACEDNGRRCCMMEFEPYYCDQIVRRYREFTGRDDIFLLRDGRRIPFLEVS